MKISIICVAFLVFLQARVSPEGTRGALFNKCTAEKLCTDSDKELFSKEIDRYWEVENLKGQWISITYNSHCERKIYECKHSGFIDGRTKATSVDTMWTPTKRRGPIAAEHQSPGPACVYLPSLIGTASVLFQSWNERPPSVLEAGMGTKTTVQGLGQANIMSPDLVRRVKILHRQPPSTLVRKNRTLIRPSAPGDYNPDLHESSPKYAFGLKVTVDKPSETPAPGAYNPELHEHKLAYSFGLKTPIGKPKDTPAPGAYDPDKPKHTPAYTFGLRTPIGKPSDTSAPGAYHLDLPEHKSVQVHKVFNT